MAPTLDVRAVRRAHLVGIGGSGMSGLARLLLACGAAVSGSDARAGAALDALRARGATVHVGHATDQLGTPELVVISAAVAPDNPEVVAARQRGLPVLTHAQVLGLLTGSSRSIAVAGTHGKTTTTALVGFLLERVGRDPTILAGSVMADYGESVRLGGGDCLVVEADEYDRRFLALCPHTAIVTSVEADHLDYYRDLAEIEAAFAEFAARLPADGLLVACADDPGARSVAARCRRVLYGIARPVDWTAHDVAPAPGGMCFRVVAPDGTSARASTRLVGRHNVLNALAALAAVAEDGVALQPALAALAEFRGTQRRFESVGTAGGVWVVDDYAHHPTAVRATLAAARTQHSGPLWVVFQPHTRNRTAALLDAFARAFGAADEVIVTPIYEPVGREQAMLSVSGADLAARIVGPRARYVADLDEAAALLVAELPPGALLLTMGAGDVNALGPRVLAELQSR